MQASQRTSYGPPSWPGFSHLPMQQIDLRNISSSISLQVRRLRVFLFGLAAEPLGLGLFTPMFLEDSE